MNTWIPASTPPESGQEVLMIASESDRAGNTFRYMELGSHNGKHWICKDGWKRNATHWMPLPELP